LILIHKPFWLPSLGGVGGGFIWGISLRKAVNNRSYY
jgi:hypothetical protein